MTSSQRRSQFPATLIIRIMVGGVFLSEGIQKFLFPAEVGAGRLIPYYGWWGLAHEGRTDFAMTLGSLYLLMVGAGTWSLDEIRSRRQPKGSSPSPVDGG